MTTGEENGTGSFYVDFGCVDASVVRLPRSVRVALGGMIFHVINRGVGRMDIFEKEPDNVAFERILEETVAVRPLRVYSDCLMPNHSHFALWTEQDGGFAAFMLHSVIKPPRIK